MNQEQIDIYEYRTKLAFHDWYYAYSDDGSVYRKGQAQYQELVKMQKVLDADRAIWNEYSK